MNWFPRLLLARILLHSMPVEQRIARVLESPEGRVTATANCGCEVCVAARAYAEKHPEEKRVVIRDKVQIMERFVGVPDLATGAEIVRGTITYISVAEAVSRILKDQKNVEIEWETSDQTEHDLGPVRERSQKRWALDPFPDQWTRRRDHGNR